MTERVFPFVPKSTRFLEPGDFWGVPLRDGTYACGRILELAPADMPSGSRTFLGALLDWRGKHPPTYDSIASANSLEQGVMHILAITKSGGAILGHRKLSLDHLEPWVVINGNTLQRGFTAIRAFRRGDPYPAMSWWSYDFITAYANQHLLPSGQSSSA